MSRSTTTNLSLGVWDEGDNPGAGSKTVLAANTGLNGNWLGLDAAVGTGHTSAGAHKADVIDGPNLKTTVADASTIELTGSPLKLSIKAGGVGGTQLATGAVTAGKIATGGVSSTDQLASDVVTTAKILDANVTSAKIANDAVTAGKISHDNNRTKQIFVVGFPTWLQGDYGKVDGVTMAGTLGIPMPRAGSITKLTACSNTGSVMQKAVAYGTHAFAAGDRLVCQCQLWPDSYKYPAVIILSTAECFGATYEASMAIDATSLILTVEVEFDD